MAILGLLREHPMHGYDLRKRLRAEFGLLSSLSFGSLYPALGRLEADGAVREQLAATWSRPSETIPLTGSLTGERAAFRARLAARTGTAARQAGGTRARKVYEITERGRALFEQLLAEDEPRGEDSRSFAVRLAFAAHLPPEGRLRLLERRRGEIADRLATTRRAADSPARPLDRYQRSLAEHAVAVAELDLEWVDGLLEAEQSDRRPGAQERRPGTRERTTTTAITTSATRSPT